MGLPSRLKTLEPCTLNTRISICTLELVSHKTLTLDDGHGYICISHLKKLFGKMEQLPKGLNYHVNVMLLV